MKIDISSYELYFNSDYSNILSSMAQKTFETIMYRAKDKGKVFVIMDEMWSRMSDFDADLCTHTAQSLIEEIGEELFYPEKF